MFVGFALGIFACIIYNSFKWNMKAGLIALTLAIVFFWWRFSVVIQLEADSRYNCISLLFCTLK